MKTTNLDTKKCPCVCHRDLLKKEEGYGHDSLCCWEMFGSLSLAGIKQLIREQRAEELKWLIERSEDDGFDVHDHMDWKCLIQDRIEALTDSYKEEINSVQTKNLLR